MTAWGIMNFAHSATWLIPSTQWSVLKNGNLSMHFFRAKNSYGSFESFVFFGSVHNILKRNMLWCWFWTVIMQMFLFRMSFNTFDAAETCDWNESNDLALLRHGAHMKDARVRSFPTRFLTIPDISVSCLCICILICLLDSIKFAYSKHNLSFSIFF